MDGRRLARLAGAAVVLLIAVLLTVVLHALASVLEPLCIAIILCYIVYPGVRFMLERHLPPLLAYLAALVLLFATLYFIGQLLFLNVDRFLADLSSYQASLDIYLERLNRLAHRLRLIRREEQLGVEHLMNLVPKDFFANLVGGSTTFFVGFVGDLMVVVFFMFFILLEIDRFPRRISLAYGPERSRAILGVVGDINRSVQSYIVLHVWVSALTAVLSILLMGLFGLHFYVLLGVSVFFFNFVPYLGPIVATVLPTVLALLQFSSPVTALWLGILLTVVHFLIGNIIEPQFLGRSLNLSPLLILVGLAFWAWLWGVVGMVLAVPIMVSMRIAFEHLPQTQPYAILMSNITPEVPAQPGLLATLRRTLRRGKNVSG